MASERRLMPTKTFSGRWKERLEAIRAFYSISKPVGDTLKSVLEQRIDGFADTNRVLMKVLYELKEVHPAIHGMHSFFHVR